MIKFWLPTRGRCIDAKKHLSDEMTKRLEITLWEELLKPVKQ